MKQNKSRQMAESQNTVEFREFGYHFPKRDNSMTMKNASASGAQLPPQKTMNTSSTTGLKTIVNTALERLRFVKK